jgi:hypothetical protein
MLPKFMSRRVCVNNALGISVNEGAASVAGTTSKDSSNTADAEEEGRSSNMVARYASEKFP